ncbi:MAG: phosphate ABC transporter permease [Methylothermaceae bacteria B42]|nr:MAG: phosphate ABC transporter permease [Methylothermaceae bacteria B42]HHJ40136.1 phosphate ABC transporter permease subunit PstC [Methylothermaceae bacterium]
MQTSTLILLLAALSFFAYYLGVAKARAVSGGHVRNLHSLPRYYGYYTALWCALPALVLLIIWQIFDDTLISQLVIANLPPEIQSLPKEQLGLFMNQVRNLVYNEAFSSTEDPLAQAAAQHYRYLKSLSHRCLFVLALACAIAGLSWARHHISPKLRARNRVEKLLEIFLITSSTIAILTTIGIVLSVLFEALRFFKLVPVTEFLFGLHWSPQMAIRPDQVGSSGAFGFIPLLTGTLLIAAIAMIVAAPIGLLAAIYLSEFASRKVRTLAKPMLEVLAGIPTVVYGFFAALVVAPFLRELGANIGVPISSESALGAGLVMGIMIIPFVSSLSDDVINAVPQSLRDGSYGLGATQAETITQIIIPAALPGIVGGLLLAVSRAIGETMIVVMAAGLTANLTLNPLESVTTITAQIVGLLVGDQEFDSPKTLAAFALGLVLFLITLALNVLALHIVRKYREQYE